MKLKERGKDTSITEITNISEHGFWIFFNDHEYFLSFKDFPWFKDARVSEIVEVKLLNEDHFYWPKLDVDLELDNIKHPEKYPLIAKWMPRLSKRGEGGFGQTGNA